MKTEEKAFRYDTTGKWYKGNTHIHSTASDGGKTIPEIVELYSTAQYDFLFCTDHWVSSDVNKTYRDSPMLLLNGIELDGDDHKGGFYHVVCLGKTEGINKDDGLELAMRKAREQNALLVLAHPFWCGNTLEEANRWDFDGVEIYNYLCQWMNGKGDGRIHWDAMLKKSPDILGFAADDSHLRPDHPGWNGGWIMVNISEFSEEAVLSAIRAGNYYSTCGPEFKSITYDNNTLHIECSPVQFIRLVGHRYNGWRTGSFDRKLLTNASVRIPEGWDYYYLELEDQEGKRAWSNTLFVTK